MNDRRLTRTASNPLKIADRAMRKMQVPAYWPAPFGVQAIENSGVAVEVKKVIVIWSIPIIVLEEDMSIAAVVVPMDMPVMVMLAELVVDIVTSDMLYVQVSTDSLPARNCDKKVFVDANVVYRVWY
jgi:hypothetical protein